MRMVDIITKKRDGGILSREEIEFFVKGYVRGDIPDYQASSLAMAIVLKGMNDVETAFLTASMKHSGDVIDLSSIPGHKADKHSTGGVGDKTTLVVAPIVASLGVKIVKMSGRGLGHTGGTLDKLESIPGLSVSLNIDKMIEQAKQIGIVVAGQTSNLDPADKKLYALRDVTGTVESIPLITSSIMSKKLASGTDSILLDVKYGSGAFMKDIDSATNLAETMVNIGKQLNKDTRAIISNMDQPLGNAVGNALEVKEAIDTLKGNGPEDFKELCLRTSAIILLQAHVCSDMDSALKRCLEAISSGKAFEKFIELVKAQGGDISYIENPDKLIKCKNIIEIESINEGYVTSIDCLKIGECAMKLGAGREKLGDNIDPSAGIIVHKKVGDLVKKGEPLATLYTNKDNINDVKKEIYEAFYFGIDKREVPKIISKYLY